MSDLYEQLFAVLDAVPGLPGLVAGRLARDVELAALAAVHDAQPDDLHAEVYAVSEVLAALRQ